METWGRIPVPWGPEPKAQVVYGLVKTLRWDQEDSEKYKPKHLDFDSLLADQIQIAPVYKNPPTIIARRSTALDRKVRDVLRWAVAKAIRKAAPPSQRRPEVITAAVAKAVFEPSAPLSWYRKRRKKTKRHAKPQLPARSKVSTLDQETQRWRDLAPPSLLAWATERGLKAEPIERIKPLDPFSTRSNVISLDQRRQIAAALKRGEWCLVTEIDVLPLNLKRWLIECNVRLIRYIGRRIVEGGGSLPSGTPVNGYVTEDGLTFYVAEDGATFYVQET